MEGVINTLLMEAASHTRQYCDPNTHSDCFLFNSLPTPYLLTRIAVRVSKAATYALCGLPLHLTIHNGVYRCGTACSPFPSAEKETVSIYGLHLALTTHIQVRPTSRSRVCIDWICIWRIYQSYRSPRSTFSMTSDSELQPSGTLLLALGLCAVASCGEI